MSDIEFRVDNRKGYAIYKCEFVSGRTGKKCDKICKNKYCSRHNRYLSVDIKPRNICEICGSITTSSVDICSKHRQQYLYAIRNFTKDTVKSV